MKPDDLTSQVLTSVAAKSPPEISRSKDGYEFDASDSRWRLSKDVTILLDFPNTLSSETERGFRATLQRYAEEMSAGHTQNMTVRFKRFLRETGSPSVNVVSLMNWRANLGKDQWQLGGLRGFLLAWHDYGFPGIDKEVVDLLEDWRIPGGMKGEAVAIGCPENGPFTDLEMSSLLGWANTAVIRGEVSFWDYSYLLALVMTARRPIQISHLRGKDLVRESSTGSMQYRLNIPRAKQRDQKFRNEFRSLPIIEDLALVLEQLHRQSILQVETAFGVELDTELSAEVPIFLNKLALAEEAERISDVRELLLGATPDRLHATNSSLGHALQRCARVSTARSERTGEFLRLTARRFRHTRGTKLRREGFGAYVIAELLDHSDIQNVSVYTKNTAQEAVVINELIGAQLAPFAQACLGRLVNSEREAIRGSDPLSRIANDRQRGVGTCGNYGFCASGYRACYTCNHFQPWIDGPHEEVLEDLYAEKERSRAAGCAEVVVNASDQLILAVEHCVLLCRESKRAGATLDGEVRCE